MRAKKSNPSRDFVVGVISDTHGRMHRNALSALAGSSIILHAGDIGSMEIIRQLETIAPVHAICGNVDILPLTKKFPSTDVVEYTGRTFYLLHNLRAIDISPKAAGFDAVIFGHSHKPGFYFEESVLFMNPGSAGPRRFSLPISVGRITIRNRELFPEIILLEQ